MDTQFPFIASLAFTLWMQIKAVGPFWIVGLFAGSVINVYLTQDMIDKVYRMRKDSFSPLSATLAAALGAASPLCMYGTIPVIVALGRKGVPQATLTAFMMGSILLNPNIFFLTFALGTSAALWRLGLCVAAGVLSGLLVQVFFRNRTVFDLEKFEPGAAPAGKTFGCDLRKSFRITAPYFAIGVILATLFEVLMPRSWINALLNADQRFEVLFSVLLSVPVYTCDGAIISLLRTWQQMGLSEGSVVAFLLAGAATKIAKLGAIKIILGMRNFIIYMGFILVFSFAAGSLINLLR